MESGIFFMWNPVTHTLGHFLRSHSRPDLGFTVSQATRFSFNPEQRNKLTLICIGQHLKQTRDKGMILQPMSSTSSFVMDACVDSDFMSLHGKEICTDPTNVKSRARRQWMSHRVVVKADGCNLA